MHTELHLHTEYSLMDGLNNAAEYMARAKEIGMEHIAITDHGTLAGHRDFQIAAKEAGITPILGLEAYISPTELSDRRPVAKRDDNTQAYHHIGLIARDAQGLQNLHRLSEIAWTAGFYSKPRIDMKVLEEHNEGLIVLSGCINGLVSKALENEQPAQARARMAEFKDIFDDRFFVEIQGHNPEYLNHGLLELAKEFNVLPVVTSDCHYAKSEDLWYEDAMLILSTSPAKNYKADFERSRGMNDFIERFNYLYPNRKMTFQEFKIFLRGYADHKALLAKQGIDDQPIKNTMVVANMIGDYPFHQGFDLLPRPKNDDPKELLRKKTIAGAKKKGTFGNPVYDVPREEQLKIIEDLGFEPYILIVANMVAWCRSKGIRVGPARGSVAGSLVCYELDIHQVDPIEHKLESFRFLNPERNDWPDIDIDIEDRRRGETKAYLQRQYKHVASIATYGQFKGKKSVRDASRVFSVPLGEVNRALKGADWLEPIDWWAEWEKTERGREFIKRYPEVIKLAKYLHGRIRERGMHAGGIVISKEPISNYAPMETASDPHDKSAPRIPLVALDMEHVADIGLIKQDNLGLKALSVITDTLDLIYQRHGKIIELEDFTYDDSAVYDMISSGHTKAVFQCEQVPYTGLLFKMGGVKNFSELAASNALVRPGAANSSAGADFIARKRGQKPVRYHHEILKPYTEDTYGTIIYQEQVMQAMVYLGGMSMATADKVRKIIGKKRDVKEFEQYKAQWLDGASNHVSREYAENLWHDFEAHAGYSFNKSHAVGYSMISYWTAWLKYYYPLEFMCAALRNEGDKDVRLDYLIEVKRLGIRVLLPHVNESDVSFTVGEDETGSFIRFGLADIKNISKKIAPKLIAARPFNSYADLVKLVGTKYNGVNSTALKSMNAVGAAYFPDNPRTGNERANFYEFLSIPSFSHEALPPNIRYQVTPLDEYSEKDAFIVSGLVRKIKTGDGWARVEIVDETGSAGIFAPPDIPIETGQMYVMLVSNNSIVRYIRRKDIIDGRGGDFGQFLEATGFPDVPPGMAKVVSFNTRKTKKGDRMANAVFADAEKNLQPAMIWPKLWPKAYTKCQPGAVLDVVFGETEDGAVFVQNIL